MKLADLFSFIRPGHRLRAGPERSLEDQLGYRFKNPKTKEQALTHKSLAGERGDGFHNERLEFLGDAVFDLAVSDLLMEAWPTADEGMLSQMRSALVNTTDLSNLALSLKLDKKLLLSASAERSQTQTQPRLLACTVEALIGAIYVDGGYFQAKKVIQRLLGPAIRKGPANKDYKSLFQELIQKKRQVIPTYHIIKTKGPLHARVFVIEVRVNKKTYGAGEGKSKKQAEQSAAFCALKKIGVDIHSLVHKP